MTAGDLRASPEASRARNGDPTAGLGAPLPAAPLSHVVYALCGHGRGHSSRALAVAGALERRGHRVTFAVGGPAADRLDAASGGAVRRVPALRQVLRGNRVRMLATARANLSLTWRSPEIIEATAAWLEAAGTDLVVADHEPFVSRAAARVGIPVVALSHQLILTETRPRVPLRLLPSAWATARGVRFLAGPWDAAVVPSFFFPPRRRGSGAALVPPILRDDVLSLRSSDGGRLLAYVNEGDGMEPFLEALGNAGLPADVYGLDTGLEAPPGVRLKAPSRAGFLADLAAAHAVVATAGFTLLSEALHLGKPVFALPNRGFFEQAVNALALRDAGRGEALLHRPPRAADLLGFLERADTYRRPTARNGSAGCDGAADAIETALGASTRHPAPRAAAA